MGELKVSGLIVLPASSPKQYLGLDMKDENDLLFAEDPSSFLIEQQQDCRRGDKDRHGAEVCQRK